MRLRKVIIISGLDKVLLKTMISIQHYNDSDYDDIKNVLKDGDLFDEVWEDRQNLKRKVERDPESILLAISDNKIAGCVFIVEDGWNAFIWRLSVLKDFREQGIGKQLMKKAEEIIKTRGIKESSIFVRSKNDLLKDWYTKQDYLKTSDYTFMYKKLNDQK
ncbi:MAG: GNAT family N-acetyltransferase [Candidatus Moranbacteria bacterium]|nr:GNAT family N-acetyltransferase [Candidatus Moranbacteria bacterium]